MTEDEALGIAENETPAAAPAEAPAQQPAEGEKLTREEMLAMCVRYERASKPYLSVAEAQEIAVSRAAGEEGYLDAVLKWHEEGEPEIEEGIPERKAEEDGAKAAPKDEDEALGIKE